MSVFSAWPYFVLVLVVLGMLVLPVFSAADEPSQRKPALMFERDRLRKSIALMVGFLDGLLGRLGGLCEAHPRVGKYLSRSDRGTGRGTTSVSS